MNKEKQKNSKKLVVVISCIVVCVAIAFVVLWYIPYQKYNDTYQSAIALMNNEKYIEAISAFESTNGYKDSVEKIAACNEAIMEGEYKEALALKETKKYLIKEKFLWQRKQKSAPIRPIRGSLWVRRFFAIAEKYIGAVTLKTHHIRLPAAPSVWQYFRQ